MAAKIVYRCGWRLLDMRDFSNFYTLLNKTFATLGIDEAYAHEPWLPLYELLTQYLTSNGQVTRVGQVSKAVNLLEQMVKNHESLAENHPDRLRLLLI